MSVSSEAVVDIAVLDDDHEFRKYMEDILGDEKSYSVDTFAHPDDLFDACQKQPPDIVLLDMKMGEFRGDKVLEELHSRWPELCVIIVTGHPSLEDMRSTFKKKVFDYLVKPFAIAQLRRILKNAVDTYELDRSPLDHLRHRLGHRIRMLRTDREWSLKDLGATTKLSISQISHIECGAHLPSMESLLAISRAFNLRPSQLLESIGF